MKDLFSPEQRRDLLRRGFTRRDFGRLAAFMTAGAALPFYNEATLAQGLSAGPRMSRPTRSRSTPTRTRWAPAPRPSRRSTSSSPKGGRYLYEETFGFIDTMADDRGRFPRPRDALRRLERPAPSGRAGLHRVRRRASSSPTPAMRPASGPPRSSEPGRSRSRSARTGRTTSARWPRPTPTPASSTSATPTTRPARSRPRTRSSTSSPTSPRGRSSCWMRLISTCRRRPSRARRWSPPTRT